MDQAESARKFYDRIAGVYDALADHDEHASRVAGLDLLAPSGDERVLEIECGTGHALVEIAERLGDGGRVVGIDISPRMLQVARARVQAGDVAQRIGPLVLADAGILPFAPASFDAVFLSFTLELFPEAQIPLVLGEIRRVLAAGGRLGVVAMNQEGGNQVAMGVYRFLHRHFPHIVDCRPIDVDGWLRGSGFSTTKRRDLSIWGLSVLAAVATARDGRHAMV